MTESRNTLPLYGGLALAAAVFAALAGWSGADGFWITDGGNKFMVLKHFLRTGTWFFEPAEFFPDGVFHFQRYAGRMYSIFPEYFPILAAPFYAVFGKFGLLLPSLAGALWALWSLGKLWLCNGMPARLLWALPILPLVTPLGFYGVEFWEMTLAAAIALNALYCLQTGRPAGAGCLLGAGLILREEFYLIAPAMLGALAWVRRDWRGPLRAALPVAGTALALWTYQYIQFGHPLGLHGARYYTHNADAIAPEAWWMRFENYYLYLLRYQAGSRDFRGYYALLYAPFVLAAVAGGFRHRPAWMDRTAVWGCAAASAVLTVLLWSNRDGAVHTVLLVGLLPSLPLAAGFFLNWRTLLGNRRWRLTALSILGFIILLPPVLTRTDFGIIWGARHFLWLAPLATVLGAWRLRKFRIPLAVLALAAAGQQGYGLWLQRNVKCEAAELTGLLRCATPRGGMIMTDAFFLPELTPELFFEREIRFVRNDAAFLAALKAERGDRPITLVLGTGPWRRIGNDALRTALPKLRFSAPPQTPDFGYAPYLRVQIAPCAVQSGQTCNAN